MILANCPHCGAIFKSRAFKFSNAVNVTLRGNKETCPNCGRMANIADGVFSFVGDTLEIISAPNVTRDMYSRFADVVARAHRGEIGKQEFAAAAEEISPEFGRIAKLTSAHWSAITLFLLLMLIQQCSVNIDVKIDANKFIDQLLGDSSVEYVLPGNENMKNKDGAFHPKTPDTTKESTGKKNREIEAGLIKQNKARLLNTVFHL